MFRMTVYTLAQQIKYQEMNLMIHVKGLLTENYKVLLREILKELKT